MHMPTSCQRHLLSRYFCALEVKVPLQSDSALPVGGVMTLLGSLLRASQSHFQGVRRSVLIPGGARKELTFRFLGGI